MNILDQINYRKLGFNYKNLALKLGLLLLPLSWVMVPALVRMSSFGVWNILRFLPFKCPLVVLFGIQCPTCGLGRSLIYVWSGQFSISMHYHFLGVIIYLSSYLFYFSILYKFWFKKSSSFSLWLKINSIKFYNRTPLTVWIILLITYIAWGFSRNPL